MSIALQEAEQQLEKHARVAECGYNWGAVEKEERHRCVTCGEIRKMHIASRDRYGFEATFHECHNCGTVWLSPRFTQRSLEDFYAHWYRPVLSAWYGRPMNADTIEESQFAYTKCVVASCRPLLQGRAGQSLLDLGGSSGITASILAEAYGLVPTVVDPSPDELAKAKERGCETILATGETMPAWRKYDIITIWQSIDHFLEPAAVLKKCRAMLNPGGLIFWDHTPFNDLRSQHPAENVLKIDHPCYFSRHAALRLIELCHLELDRFGILACDDLQLGKLWYACKPCPIPNY